MFFLRLRESIESFRCDFYRIFYTKNLSSIKHGQQSGRRRRLPLLYKANKISSSEWTNFLLKELYSYFSHVVLPSSLFRAVNLMCFFSFIVCRFENYRELQAASGEWINEFAREPQQPPRCDPQTNDFLPTSDVIRNSIRRSWTISSKLWFLAAAILFPLCLFIFRFDWFQCRFAASVRSSAKFQSTWCLSAGAASEFAGLKRIHLPEWPLYANQFADNGDASPNAAAIQH